MSRNTKNTSFLKSVPVQIYWHGFRSPSLVVTRWALFTIPRWNVKEVEGKSTLSLQTMCGHQLGCYKHAYLYTNRYFFAHLAPATAISVCRRVQVASCTEELGNFPRNDCLRGALGRGGYACRSGRHHLILF